MHLETYGDMLVKAMPDREGAVNKGLRGRGKFGFDCAVMEDKILGSYGKKRWSAYRS